MERYAWKAQIRAGTRAEYIKRHDEIWPEMKKLLKDAGIRNYSIWLEDTTLFGYYECEQGIAYAAKAQSQSDLVAKWDEYMKDILIMEKDPLTGAQPKLEQVFLLE